MSRQTDLEQLICDSHQIIRECEADLQAESRPEEWLRIRRTIQRQIGLVEGYLLEYRPLVSNVLPPDLAAVADHLPEARALLQADERRAAAEIQAYCAAVAQFCRDLPYVSLRQDVPLETVYVRQQITKKPAEKRGEKETGRQRDDEQSEAQRELEEQERHAIPMPIAQALQERPRIAVQGGPGAGKSTLLRHLVQQVAEGQDAGLGKPYLPILVSLRGLADRRGDLTSGLRAQVAEELGTRLASPLPDRFLDAWAAQTGMGWLIALDGLDEVVDADRRRLLLRRLAQTPWPAGARVIVTTRPDEAAAGLEGFTPFDLLPFEAAQVGEFARRWFKNNDEHARAFLDALRSARLGGLTGTPLLLTVAAVVFEETLKNSDFFKKSEFFASLRRAHLYDRFVDILLEEDRAPNRQMQVQFRERFGTGPGETLFRHRRRVLEQVALSLQEERDVQASLVDLLRQKPFEWSEWDADDGAQAVLEVLGRQRSGLLTRRRGEAWEFVHPTFREFLAAAAIVRLGERDPECVWECAVSRWQEESWREVALLVLGVWSQAGRDTSAWVKRIWRKRSEEKLYFAGDALAEGAAIESRLSTAVIDGLLAEAREGPQFDDDDTAFEILGKLRPYPRAGDGLLLLAWDEQVDALVCVQAAEALGRLGQTDEAASALLSLAQDGQVDVGVCVRAAAALGELGRVDDLLGLARDGQVDVRVRMQTAEALGALGQTDEAAQAWLLLARDGQIDVEVRVEAAETLGALGQTDEAAQAWLSLAQDGPVSVEVRQQAAEALGELGQADDQAVSMAARAWLMLARDCQVDVEVCLDAVEALGELEQINDLLMLARDEQVDVEVRVEAAETLDDLGQADEAARAWLALAQDGQVWGWVREQAAEALVELGQTEEAASLLLGLARNGQVDVEVYVDAAETLGELGRVDEAAAILLELVRDVQKTGARVRQRMAESLGWFADACYLSDLEQIAQQDVDPHVRRAAQQAIERIRQRAKGRAPL